MMDSVSSLSERHQQIWRELADAAADRGHPWRLPAIATTNSAGRADQRIMVLRAVDAERRRLGFTTDRRSAKVGQITATADSHLLFWNPVTAQQLRVTATATLRTNDAELDAMWEQVPVPTRATFKTANAPGTIIDAPLAAGESDDEDGRQNFTVMDFVIAEIEALELCDPVHHRYRFRYSGTMVQMNWLAP